MIDESQIINNITRLKQNPATLETARKFSFFYQRYFSSFRSVEWWFSWGLFFVTVVCLSAVLWLLLDCLKKAPGSPGFFLAALLGSSMLVPSYIFRFDASSVSGLIFPFKLEWLPHVNLMAFAGFGGMAVSIFSLVIYENIKEKESPVPEWGLCRECGSRFNIREVFPYELVNNPCLPLPSGIEPTPSLSLPENNSLDETVSNEPVRARVAVRSGKSSTGTAAERGLAFMVVANGDRQGTVFPLQDDTVSFGRDTCLNDIFFEDEKISGQHARIKFEDGRFKLYDLASTNKVFINGEQSVSKELSDGDRIRLGDTEMIFKETSV